MEPKQSERWDGNDFHLVQAVFLLQSRQKNHVKESKAKGDRSGDRTGRNRMLDWAGGPASPHIRQNQALCVDQNSLFFEEAAAADAADRIEARWS